MDKQHSYQRLSEISEFTIFCKISEVEFFNGCHVI